MNIENIPDKLEFLFRQAMQSNLFSGAVLGIAHIQEEKSIIHAWGKDDYTDSASDITIDWVFDLASITKVFPTSVLALDMILEGELDVRAPVVSLYPQLRTSHRQEVQIFHLLTHSLDWSFPMSSLKELGAREILERLCTHRFSKPPGTLFQYGNASSILLGLVLREISGKALDELSKTKLFDPLGLKQCGWNPLKFVDKKHIMPTEICPWRNRILRGEVHDESAYAMQTIGPLGSAGMFGTAGDLLCFAKMLMQDGFGNGKQVCAPGILDLISQNALPQVAGAYTALGFELNNPRFMGAKATARTFGKTGFTGTSLLCSPDHQIAVVLLSNFTWPRRESSVERIYEFRRAVHDLILSD